MVGALQEMEIGFDLPIVAAAAVGGTTVVISGKTASGGEKVMEPFCDDDELV